MKKVVSFMMALCLTLTLCLSLGSCGEKKDGTYTVGICQLVTHPALDAATEGFKQALIDILGEDKVTFDVQNAANEPSTCTTIVNSFVSKNVDLIMANATPALQAAANSTTTIPILGTSVTEYGVALKLKDFNGTVGGNISGTSDLAPLDEQAQMILDLVPTAKKVGLLYCSAEPNSDYQARVIREILEGKGLTCEEYKFSDSNDVAQVSEKAASDCDVIYVPTDNTAASCGDTINNVVLPKKVPIIAGEEGICSKCGIATLSISYYDIGYKTGEMAAKVLTGEAKISEMPIEYSAKPTKKYNKESCEALGITIPDGYEAIGE